VTRLVYDWAMTRALILLVDSCLVSTVTYRTYVTFLPLPLPSFRCVRTVAVKIGVDPIATERQLRQISATGQRNVRECSCFSEMVFTVGRLMRINLRSFEIRFEFELEDSDSIRFDSKVTG